MPGNLDGHEGMLEFNAFEIAALGTWRELGFLDPHSDWRAETPVRRQK